MALNAYQSEKNMISKSLERISDFKKDLRYYEHELKERESEAETYLKDLPEQMSGMFNHLEGLVNQQEKQFYTEIAQIVKKQ